MLGPIGAENKALAGKAQFSRSISIKNQQHFLLMAGVTPCCLKQQELLDF